MRDSLDDDKIGEFKKVDNKRKKKEKRDNLDTHENEFLQNYEKKQRENCMMTLKDKKENKENK